MPAMDVLLACACLPLVAASIYPTQPVQATVWSADEPMSVRWIEDGKHPSLRTMGPVGIALWCNTDTYLVQLASDVDPTAKGCQVTVPGSALIPGATYTLRFTTRTPIDAVMYSGDFTIVPANATTTTTRAGSTTTTTARAGSTSAWTTAAAAVGPGQRVASAGRRGVDVEKLKFRFVFVIWPVLMGITMAL